MITLLYSYVSHGPGKVIANLKKGLHSLDVEYQTNPSLIRHNDSVISLQWDDCVKHINPKNLLIGPNVCTLPIDNEFIMSGNYRKVVVPSQWIKDKYKKWIPEEKIFVWPVGIDTETFSDKSKDSKEFDCLVYFKRRSEEDLLFIEDMLKRKGQSFNVITYGNYTEEEFLELISKSKYAIAIDNCESQGIAIEEMMSCNIPLFVWDVTTWSDRGEEFACPSTSIPFWDERCGEKIYIKEEADIKFEIFLEKLGNYAPRCYILENLTLEKQASEIIKEFDK